MSWWESILVVLGLKIQVMITSAIGAFGSLSFFENLTVFKRWTTFITGCSIGAWGSGAAIELIAHEIPTLTVKAQMKIEMGLGLFFSLFGMSLVAAFIKAIPEFIDALRGMIPKRN